MLSIPSITSTNRGGGYSGGALLKNFTQLWDPNLLFDYDTTSGLEPRYRVEILPQMTIGTLGNLEEALHQIQTILLQRRENKAITETESRLLALILVLQMPHRALAEVLETIIEIRDFYSVESKPLDSPHTNEIRVQIEKTTLRPEFPIQEDEV